MALVLLACLTHPATAGELDATEAARIEYLIQSVADLREAHFIRNGKAHDSKAAADHLRRKLKAAGTRVRKAEDFIRLCASASSVTGTPYRIRFAAGREVDAEAFFRQRLAEYAPPAEGTSKTSPVRSTELGLEFRAPSDWVVRQFTRDEEHVVAITRELLDGFPRYHVGLTAISVDAERRKAKRTPGWMAGGLCAQAAKRSVTHAQCTGSVWNGYRRFEWIDSFPAVSGTAEGSRARIVLLADDPSDTLIRIMFEAPESEWATLQDTASTLMAGVRKLERRSPAP